MIKTLVSITFFFIVLAAGAQQRTELKWKKINSLSFDVPETQYTTDSICFYHALLTRKNHHQPEEDEQAFSFPIHAKPLDVYNYWDQKGEEQYDVLLTKVAYVLDKPVNFFSRERLSDTAFISKTMPTAKIKKNDDIYHISVGFGAPEIDYTLNFYSPEEFKDQYPELPDYFKAYDGLDQLPEIIAVQHNYNYGKVMFHDTSKMSISISRYFKLNDQQTLAFNYTLNYIQNLPPSLFGGSDFLIHQIKKGIMALIDETQYVCRITD